MLEKISFVTAPYSIEEGQLGKYRASPNRTGSTQRRNFLMDVCGGDKVSFMAERCIASGVLFIPMYRGT